MKPVPKLLRLMFLCSLMIVASRPISAQIPVPMADSIWETSFFFGTSSAGDSSFATPLSEGGAKQVGMEFESSYVLGARVTENLGQYFGAELEYAVSNRPLVLTNLLPAIPRLELDHKLHQLAYSVLVYGADRSHRLRPFGSIGFGTSLFHVSGSSQDEALEQGVDLKNRWKLAFTFGGGLKFRAGRNWGLRVDLRDQISGFSDFGLPSQASAADPARAGIRPNGLVHNWNISGGISYYFSR